MRCGMGVTANFMVLEKSLLIIFENSLKKSNICHMTDFEYKFERQSLKL